jgi:hypothetical protein
MILNDDNHVWTKHGSFIRSCILFPKLVHLIALPLHKTAIDSHWLARLTHMAGSIYCYQEPILNKHSPFSHISCFHLLWVGNSESAANINRFRNAYKQADLSEKASKSVQFCVSFCGSSPHSNRKLLNEVRKRLSYENKNAVDHQCRRVTLWRRTQSFKPTLIPRFVSSCTRSPYHHQQPTHATTLGEIELMYFWLGSWNKKVT